MQLTLARIREFYREPAAVFWVYCFPILIAVALGIAFREKPVEKITIDIREDAGSPEAIASLTEKLKQDERVTIHPATGDEWMKRLRSGKTDLVIAPRAEGGFEFWDEPTGPRAFWLGTHWRASSIAPRRAPRCSNNGTWRRRAIATSTFCSQACWA